MSNRDRFFLSNIPNDWINPQVTSTDCHMQLHLKPKRIWAVMHTEEDDKEYFGTVIKKYEYTAEDMYDLWQVYPTMMELCEVNSLCSIVDLVKAMKLLIRREY